MDTKQAFIRAYELMTFHGLVQLGWTFRLDRGKSRAGLCDDSKKQISVSIHLVKNGDVYMFENIILHEIAHALVGCRHKHDEVWRAKAIEIGCDGDKYVKSFCPRAWTITCPCGANNFEKHVLHRKTLNRVCIHCGQYLTASRRSM